jgi:hypothetical protein
MLFRKILDGVDPIYRMHSAQLFQIHRTASEYSGIELLHFSYADEEDIAMWNSEEEPLSGKEIIFRVQSMERRLNSRTKGLLETPTSFLHNIRNV